MSEMSEMVSLKMGVKPATAFNMGEKMTHGSIALMCR